MSHSVRPQLPTMPDNFNGKAMQQFQFNNVATGDSFGLSALEKDGQIWFVAADVCKALGIKNSRDALSNLDDDEKGVATTDTLGGRQQVATINESGLYTLIFRSRKASAQGFRKWVTSRVIPSIRRHGGYINGQEALPAEQQAETLLVVQKEAQRVGLCVAEEKEARSGALKHMGRGRRHRKVPRAGKMPEDTRNGY